MVSEMSSEMPKRKSSKPLPPALPRGPHILAVCPVGATHSAPELTQLFLTKKGWGGGNLLAQITEKSRD